jgi:exosortase/archaeosortase
MVLNSQLTLSEDLRQEILTNLIEPSFKEDIANNLKLKKKFKKLGLFFETVSKLFVGVSSILSFSSGMYKYQVLAFLSGTSSVISLVTLQYSSYSYRESKKISSEINSVLGKLNIETIPEIKSTIEDYGSEKNSIEPNTPK